MIPRLLPSTLPLFSLFTLAGIASAQAPAGAQPKQPPAGAPNPKQWSADGSVPVSQTMQSLEARMATMLSGASGLTADEVAQKAQDTSPDVAAKRLATEAQDAKIDQARDQFYPKLTGTARYTRLSSIEQGNLGGGYIVGTNKPGPVTFPLPQDQFFGASSFSFPVVLNNYDLRAQLTVPISDYVLRYSRAVRGAKQSRRGSELDERAARLKVGADARLNYYNWIRAQGQLLVSEQALELSKGRLTDAQRSFEVGMVSKADVLRASSSVSINQLGVARAQNLVNLSEDQLRIVMHDGLGKKYQIGENILAPLPPMANVESPEKLQAEALERRLEIRSLDETAFSLREGAQLQKVGNLPRVDLQATGIFANPNQRFVPQQEKFNGSWDASIILSWTPTDIPNVNAQAAETAAKASQVEAQKGALRDGVRLEVTQAWNALKESDVALESTHAALLASEENYRVRRDLYRNGRATSVDLTDAETDLTRSRLEAVNARIDARIARVRVLHATGRDVPAGADKPSK
jgi:outer membrane protein TolC